MPTVPPLGLLFLAATALFPQLRQPPSPLPEAPRLSPLPLTGLSDLSDRQARKQWEQRRDTLRAEWQEILGPFPRRVPLNVREISREELPDHTRILLEYQSDDRAKNDAYLLIPKGLRKKAPGMVILHATSKTHIQDPVGINGREAVHFGLHLVRRGYVCIAPRNFLWSDPKLNLQQVTRKLLAPPTSSEVVSSVKPAHHWKTGMAKMTWEAIRATDVLAARPEVDTRRIGTIGHSLGGKEVIYHAAFDDRIRATVSCEGGVGLSFSNWQADWYLGAKIRQPDFRRDNHEVVSLIAPRAFLLIGGESADGAPSWPYIEATLPVWRLYNAEGRIGLLRHTDGHNPPKAGPDRELMYRWLDHWMDHQPSR